MALYVFLSLVWLAFIVSVVAVLATWGGLPRKVWAARYALLVITCLFCVLYVSRLDTSFMGLEYEDAFEYVYAGQVLAQDSGARSFVLNPVCVDGSREACLSYATLSHPIGLATLISWPARLLGRSLLYGGAVSLFFMWIASIGVFALLRLWDVGAVYAVLGSVLFMTCPVCLALGGTSLAEPTTTGLLVVSVLLAEVLVVRRHSGLERTQGGIVRAWLVLALASALTLAIFTKRESLWLVVVLPASYLVLAALRGRGSLRSVVAESGLVVAVCGAVFAVAWLAGGSGLFDWNSIQPTTAAPFSLTNLERWAPEYLAHLFSVRFLALVPLAIVGVLTLGRSRRPVVVLPLVVGYMALFASFSQDFFAESTGQIPYFHFERYTLEITPFLAALAAMGLGRVGEFAGRYVTRRAVAALALVAGLLLVAGGAAEALPYRQSLSREEAGLRRKPVEAACARIPAGGWVVTDEPIVFALYCGPSVDVLATATIGVRAVPVARLVRLRDTGHLFLWKNLEDTPLETNRYPAVAAFLRTTKPTELFRFAGSGGSFGLYRLSKR